MFKQLRHLSLVALCAGLSLPSCSQVDKWQSRAIKPPESNVSTVSISLPKQSSINGPGNLLTGYRLVVKAVPAGCNKFHDVDYVGKWSDDTLTQKIIKGCDYEVLLQLGELDTAGASLKGIYFSNESGQADNRTLKKESFENKTVAGIKLKMDLTDAGKAAGFKTGTVITPDNNNNNNNNNNGNTSGFASEIEPDSDLHNIFDGVSWQIQNGYLVIDGGEKPMGSDSLVKSCLDQFGESFKKWSDDQQVKMAHFYATAVTESGCKNLKGSGDGLSSGIMQVTGSTGNGLLSKLGRSFGSAQECMEAMSSDPDLSIELGARYMAQPAQIEKNTFAPINGQSSPKGPALDPPKVAAGYNAGSLRESSSNRWHLVTTGNHIDRYVAAYNSFIAYAKQESTSTSLFLVNNSFALHGSQTLPISVETRDQLDQFTSVAVEGDSIFVGDFAAKNGDFFYLVRGQWRGSLESW